MATYVNDLRLTELATGEGSGTWGTTTNTSLELLGEAMGVGAEAIANASTHTITMADGATDQFRSTFLRLTGGGQACTVTLAPNTVSHFWIMRNETAAALTLTQGSGANVVIAAGQTKLVCTDGAGSGAIVYEVDDLELAGNLIVGDNVSLLSDSSVLTFGADGDTTLTHTDGTGLTLNSTNKLTFGDVASFVQQSSDGVLRVDGEATIDLNASTAVTVSNDLKLDSDSAVLGFGADNDTTLTHTDGSGLTLNSTNKIMFNDASQFIQGSSATVLALGATDEIDLTATALDFNGNADVSGTLAVGGVVTANAGVVVDNITIDGTEIDLSSGNLTLDVAGNIVLNADGGQVVFSDGSTQYGNFLMNNSGDLSLHVETADKLFKITGTDGSSGITPLSIDMSAAGAATFNSSITSGGNITVGGTNNLIINDSGAIVVGANNDVVISNTGSVFNEDSQDADFRVESNGNTHMLYVDAGNNAVGIGVSDPGGLPLHLKVASGDNKLRMETANKDAFVMELEDSSGNLKLGTNSTAGALVIADNGAATFSGNVLCSDIIASGSGGLALQTDDGVKRITVADSGLVVINETGADADFQVESDADANAFFVNGGDGVVSFGGMGTNTRSPSGVQPKFQANSLTRMDSSISLCCNSNDALASLLMFSKTRSGNLTGATTAQAGDAVGAITWNAADGTDIECGIAAIDAVVESGIGSNDTPGALRFYTNGGTTSASERMRITGAGDLLVGTDSSGQPNENYFQARDASGFQVAVGHSNSVSNGQPYFYMTFAGVAIGSITQATTSSVAFNTTSDYRLKENVIDLTNATTKLKQLSPKRFNFISDPDITIDGFLAHEVQSIVPEAITGEKDGVDDDGNPVYQGIDQSKLVPLLVATIQELEARIAALESE